MIRNTFEGPGFALNASATCDFGKLKRLGNEAVLAEAGQSDTGKLARFIEQKMGIEQRYHCDDDQNALDLARDALASLLERSPELTEQADFFIYAGISNPMPVATHSALLAHEFGFHQPSCWDLKSGCSTGVLALIQALQWFSCGARRGVIVASETMSKFANPSVLQMAAAVGDGAAALDVSACEAWRVKALVHGTDPRYVTNMLVPGTFPRANDDYDREDYRFTFNGKADGLEALQHYWVSSLSELLTQADISGAEIQHYIAHQVDEGKNREVAEACGVPGEAVAKNFRHYGNMGCPTVFINDHQWRRRPEFQLSPGDHWVWHAVGGGLSWAGICLQYRG